MILDNLILQKVAVPNLLVNGAIGTAATISNYTSAITINQTTAGISATIPAPTSADTTLLVVQNIGTVAITVAGTIIPIGKYTMFTWNGTTWVSNSDTSPSKFYVSQALIVGNNTITHNLNLATPKAVTVSIIEDATGQVVITKIPGVTMLTNSLVINSVTAVGVCNITIVG
jgi:hypothetical protein